ncbi:tyrosine-type recombinase/integrase [Pelagibacterium luteolum]|uniref:Phage integrase, N-terminal SAM-like domain n=1 Tax=Pelagibacterium luteolum TaxID=440168 RepID=A0A1G7XVA4_9HYPH|nr:tyrosine-type recombinase/integrase [Pelagibacterium luteolum]SDG88127.1 Phage integrase, N-terminal SAM-like domain [Pelagibacterium luteolum]
MADWRPSLRRLEGAYAEATISSYRCDFEKFAAWCRRRRLRALPAKPETVAAYIEVSSEEVKPTTLKRRLSAIAKVHRIAGHVSPTDDEAVALAIRRAKRSKPGRPQQALGVTAERRDRLMSACSDDLAGLRDKVLVAVGFDTLCRRAELVALRVEDFTRAADGTYNVLVRRAKNDQAGLGRIARLSHATSRLVDQWLATTAIQRGPLLRPVYRTILASRYLHPSFVGATLKRLSRAAGYPAEESCRTSGHSLRVGAAQELTVMGHGLLPIMSAGGWKSTAVVARYIENVEMNVWAGK